MTRDKREAPEKQAPAPHPPGEKRVLVIANETVGGSELLAELKRHARGRKTEVLVVTPALNSPLKHWVSDEDGARAAAAERLEASLETMRAAGMKARGEVGDGDPVQAIDDALRTFAPDEIVISTHPEGRSNWLERGVVDSGPRALRRPDHPRRRRSRRRRPSRRRRELAARAAARDLTVPGGILQSGCAEHRPT